MRHFRLLPALLSLLVVAACGENEPPTAPHTPGAPVFDHTAGHKVVNSLADPGNGICNATQCTLREAITDQATTEISFAPGLAGGILTLATPAEGGGTLRINRKLSITGPSARVVIRRRGTDPAFRIFEIGADVTVALTNLVIRRGKVSGSEGGGGIRNFGTLRLTSSVVADNLAVRGGGIFNNAGSRLTLTNSTVAQNSAHDFGGGIWKGTLTVTTSTVADNLAMRGGGIFDNGGTITATKSVVAGNSAALIGGGIENFGTLTLQRSTVTGNSAADFGGGIVNDWTLELTNSTVAGNSASGDGGGGLVNPTSSRLTLTKSTVAGNSAPNGFGAGILNGGTLQLANSTVSGNSAATNGGGIFNPDGAVTLRNSTVAGNSATQGGGIYQEFDCCATLRLTNTLVALNRAPTGPDVLKAGGTVTVRFSLIRIGSGSGITNGVNGNQVGSRSAPLDPKLGPLTDNGGPTLTHALLLGSPAIDAASTPDCPTTDQRGVLRPQGAACDIGSYERR